MEWDGGDRGSALAIRATVWRRSASCPPRCPPSGDGGYDQDCSMIVLAFVSFRIEGRKNRIPLTIRVPERVEAVNRRWDIELFRWDWTRRRAYDGYCGSGGDSDRIDQLGKRGSETHAACEQLFAAEHVCDRVGLDDAAQRTMVDRHVLARWPVLVLDAADLFAGSAGQRDAAAFVANHGAIDLWSASQLQASDKSLARFLVVR